MIHRPILMSLLGWALILLNGLAFVVILIFWDHPLMAMLATGAAMPLGWYKGGALIESAIMFAAGIGILKGLDWSRYVFVGVQIADPLLDYITDSRIHTGPVAAVLIVAATIYLFRPAANDWFSQ